MTETLTPVRPGKLIIDGKAVDSASGKTYVTYNPATEEPICDVAEAGPEDVDRAVQAARTAFESGPWPKMKPAERQRALFKLGDLILQHGDELGRLETPALDDVVEHEAFIQPLHPHEPVDWLTIATDRELVTALRERHDPKINICGQPPVQP